MSKDFEEIKFPNMKVEYRSTASGDFRKKEFAIELREIAEDIEKYDRTEGKTRHCKFKIDERGAL